MGKKKKKVPIGRTVMVRNGHINKGTKKPNTTQLKYYKGGNSYFKHFVEVEDTKSNPLRVGKDITQNHKNMDLSKSDISHIYTTILNSREKDSFYKNMKKDGVVLWQAA